MATISLNFLQEFWHVAIKAHLRHSIHECNEIYLKFTIITISTWQTNIKIKKFVIFYVICISFTIGHNGHRKKLMKITIIVG